MVAAFRLSCGAAGSYPRSCNRKTVVPSIGGQDRQVSARSRAHAPTMVLGPVTQSVEKGRERLIGTTIERLFDREPVKSIVQSTVCRGLLAGQVKIGTRRYSRQPK